MTTFTIDTDKIREVIGPSGKMINQIIEECDNVKIDIDDNGKVIIYHISRDSINKAKDMIMDIARVAKVGDIYDAKVVRIEKFGAFVELFKGQDALLHISKIAKGRLDKVEDALHIGDTIKVVVTEVNEKGASVSAKDLLSDNNESSEIKEESKGEKRYFGKKA